MIDHLMLFASEAAAHVALAPLGYAGNGPDGPYWDGSRVLPRVSVGQPAVWDTSDPAAPVLVSPETLLPGYFLSIGAENIDTRLRDLADAACRLIVRRPTPDQPQQILHVAAGIDPGMLSTLKVWPLPAGAAYHFGG